MPVGTFAAPGLMVSNGSMAPKRNAGEKQLKVQDALHYLDLVKQTFGHIPDIYDNFLNIMKDFKSQSYPLPLASPAVSTIVSKNQH